MEWGGESRPWGKLGNNKLCSIHGLPTKRQWRGKNLEQQEEDLTNHIDSIEAGGKEKYLGLQMSCGKKRAREVQGKRCASAVQIARKGLP